MKTLDNLTSFDHYDKASVYESVTKFPDQLASAWSEVTKIDFKLDREISNIILCGMGGSALGGRVIKTTFANNLYVPFEVVTHYDLPRYVNDKSLVILSSYSGSTEETISALHDAQNKTKNIFVVATGGRLAEIAKAQDIASFIFNPVENPSKAPRLAVGYSVGFLLALLSKLSLINLTNEQFSEALDETKLFMKSFLKETPTHENIAKTVSIKLVNRMPVLIASEHLLGAAHVFKNEINETAKTFSALFDLPEANHHLMEGLANPKKIKEILTFLVFESNLYHERVVKRYKIFEEVLVKNEVNFIQYKLHAKTRLAQSFEVMLLGSFAQFYLGYLYGVDPISIPWVDYFKAKLV